MDSNSKYIRFRKLWTVKDSARRRCYTQKQLQKFITNLKAESVKSCVINVGANDVNRQTGRQVFADIKKNVETLKTKYPDIKIILAELTPRKDAKDSHINTCNQLINEWAPGQDNIVIANHANLREDKNRFLEDNKHVARKQIGTFVVNLKRALCEAYGKTYMGKADYARAETERAAGANESRVDLTTADNNNIDNSRNSEDNSVSTS